MVGVLSQINKPLAPCRDAAMCESLMPEKKKKKIGGNTKKHSVPSEISVMNPWSTLFI